MITEDEPDIATLADLKIPQTDTLLGLYRGIPRTARGENYGLAGPLPDTITLYRLPILSVAAEEGVPVRQVIEDTIWHEVAHHFGLDEDAVEEREKKRR